MAEERVTLTLRETADNDFLKDIQAGLSAYNQQTIGITLAPVNFILSDGVKTFGGMKAGHVGRHFLISWLLVDAAVRKHGWGTAMIQAAEDKALELGCIKLFVDTMSFQAPGFYVKNGFEVCARIENFYEGHDRIFYRKDIRPAAA